jgi:hypothetical protein
MRRTPPVAAQLQSQRVTQAVIASIAALAAGGLAAWAVSHHLYAWPALLVAPGAAFWAWRTSAVRPRRLRWDGQAWWLAEPGRDDEARVQLAVLIDLGAWLLLRAEPGPVWLPLSRSQQPQWGALRATLFSAPGGAVQR